MNSNGTFSVGKTWKLHELRAIEVVNVSCMYIISPRCILTVRTALGVQYHAGEDVQVED
jgi:Exocyst complex component SEC3 N-terminal PIP2 binding PH